MAGKTMHKDDKGLLVFGASVITAGIVLALIIGYLVT